MIRTAASESLPKLWTCSKCSKPISRGTGHILVMDAESGGYPRRPTIYPEYTGDEIVTVNLAEYAGPPPDQIAFDVVHHECDPHPDREEYWVAVERAATLTEWCAWVLHLSVKTWMGKVDLRNMLSFWFRNRGRKDDLYV